MLTLAEAAKRKAAGWKYMVVITSNRDPRHKPGDVLFWAKSYKSALARSKKATAVDSRVMMLR